MHTPTDRADPPAPAETSPHAGALRPCFDHALMCDRAYGALLGAALGDALGLQAEGADPATVSDRHPHGVDLPYKGSYRGYAPNDWTDATDCTVLVMRALIAYTGGTTESPDLDFAARLNRWHKSGFPELGDTAGLTPEGVVVRAMSLPGFLCDPSGAARQVRGPRAENGALIRSIPCAFTAEPSLWAALFCEVTHADDRCLATATMFAELLSALSRVPDGEPVAAMIAVGPISAGRGAFVPGSEGDPLLRERDYLRHLTNTKDLEGPRLGERDNRSYTVKTASCAIWALRRLASTAPPARDSEFFADVLRQVAAQGGDASANCYVVGAVLGAAMGQKGLPQAWLDALPHREWLVLEIKCFLEAVAPTWAGV